MASTGNVNVEDFAIEGTSKDDFGDEELLTISTRDFNRKMKSQMLTEQEKTRLRKKRRCLKNRRK